VLAEVLGRDSGQLSASQTWQQALSDADHLAVLHSIWTAETTSVREQRYADLLTAALPQGHRQGLSHKAKWLWRTLRTAELAGLDARQILADAVDERNLDMHERRQVTDLDLKQQENEFTYQDGLHDIANRDHISHAQRDMELREAIDRGAVERRAAARRERPSPGGS
jgi:hypothetical protein